MATIYFVKIMCHSLLDIKFTLSFLKLFKHSIFFMVNETEIGLDVMRIDIRCLFYILHGMQCAEYFHVN